MYITVDTHGSILDVQPHVKTVLYLRLAHTDQYRDFTPADIEPASWCGDSIEGVEELWDD